MKLATKIKKIKMIILDVDGVLTDGGLIIGHHDFEYIRFNVQDGSGIVMAQKVGYRFAIITGRNTPIVDRRAQMLGIKDVYQRMIFKIDAYEDILKKHRLSDAEVCYIGDDILDIPVLERAGFSVVPSSAVKDVRKYADYMTKRAGGDGAVREALDLILDLSGNKQKLIRQVKDKTLPVRTLA